MDGDEVEAALRVLGDVRRLPVDDPVRMRVQRAVDGLLKDAQRQRRANRRRDTAAGDRAVVAEAATAAPDRAEGVPVIVPKAASGDVPKVALDNASGGVPKVALDNASGGVPKVALDNASGGAPKAALNNASSGVPKAALDNASSGVPKAALNNASGGVPKVALDNASSGAPKAALNNAPSGAPKAAPSGAPKVALNDPAGVSGGSDRTRRDRRCYACRGRYRVVDAFYHALCPSCAEVHRGHRDARTDLGGRRAVVTGGRVKIGFQVALKLLRDGAAVTVVTRFPADAARRYAQEPDAANWLSSLRIIGADLRDPRQVLDLAGRLYDGGRPLDILINNAAQTVRRPAWAYQPLVAAELPATRESSVALASRGPAVEMVAGYRPGAASPEWSAALESAAEAGTELASLTDATGALIVGGSVNSWNARIGEIDPVELLEVQLVNVVAPFLLVDRLAGALTAGGTGARYVVNVTGREGWFGEDGPGPEGHPHTSVSKAALNMLTRVGAPELARNLVYMCGVDTGWITDENPSAVKARRAAAGWRPPLDVVDAAARIYHPIISGEAGKPLHGVLLKNYSVVPW